MFDDPEFWRGVIGQGGATIIAVLVFLAYRKDMKGTADVLMTVVRENTASNTELISLLKAMHGRMDREDGQRHAAIQTRSQDRSPR